MATAATSQMQPCQPSSGKHSTNLPHSTGKVPHRWKEGFGSIGKFTEDAVQLGGAADEYTAHVVRNCLFRHNILVLRRYVVLLES